MRSQRAGCPGCQHGHGKGEGHAADDEEALLGGEEAECEEREAGASEQIAPAQCRDEVEGGETS